MINIFIIYLDTVIYLIFVIRWVKYAIFLFLFNDKLLAHNQLYKCFDLGLCCKLKYQHEDLICVYTVVSSTKCNTFKDVELIISLI